MFETAMSINNIPILRVKGKIIGNTAVSLKNEIDLQVEEAGAQLILDLTEVPLLDSSALSAIVATLQKLRQTDGKMVLLNPQKSVMNVLKVTRLHLVLEIYDNEDSAVKAFN
tara:strand:+ start:269 stop:604 length:336 start_codon:yes stop_codon:yes gene_type:complete